MWSLPPLSSECGRERSLVAWPRRTAVEAPHLPFLSLALQKSRVSGSRGHRSRFSRAPSRCSSTPPPPPPRFLSLHGMYANQVASLRAHPPPRTAACGGEERKAPSSSSSSSTAEAPSTPPPVKSSCVCTRQTHRLLNRGAMHPAGERPATQSSACLVYAWQALP